MLPRKDPPERLPVRIDSRHRLFTRLAAADRYALLSTSPTIDPDSLALLPSTYPQGIRELESPLSD